MSQRKNHILATSSSSKQTLQSASVFYEPSLSFQRIYCWCFCIKKPLIVFYFNPCLVARFSLFHFVSHSFSVFKKTRRIFSFNFFLCATHGCFHSVPTVARFCILMWMLSLSKGFFSDKKGQQFIYLFLLLMPSRRV